MSAGTDFNGKNQNAAGTDYGVTGGVGSSIAPFVEFAGAGASVPLLGFGNILMKGVKEGVQETGFIGLFQGGFKAGAVGSSAALILGLLAAFIFKPKMKK